MPVDPNGHSATRLSHRLPADRAGGPIGTSKSDEEMQRHEFIDIEASIAFVVLLSFSRPAHRPGTQRPAQNLQFPVCTRQSEKS